MIEYRTWITRKDLKREPEKVFLFGDNLQRKGFGGQAKEMRGEPNAIGIVTKKKPSNSPDAFLSDDDYESNCDIIDADFAQIPREKIIVIPASGIGTGLARMVEKAPRTFEYLQRKLKELE